jgi:hypothetical protein
VIVAGAWNSELEYIAMVVKLKLLGKHNMEYHHDVVVGMSLGWWFHSGLLSSDGPSELGLFLGSTNQEAMRFFVIGLFCYFISTILVLSLVLNVTFTCMSLYCNRLIIYDLQYIYLCMIYMCLKTYNNLIIYILQNISYYDHIIISYHSEMWISGPPKSPSP